MKPASALPPFVLRLALAACLPVGDALAAPTVSHERATAGFRFKRIAAPAINDAGAKARITVVDGRRDGNGAGEAVLVDGRLPGSEDQPSASFFFSAGTDGGRIRLDLPEAIEIGSVATYSWHRGSRAPQVYRVWAAAGDSPGFEAAPARPVDPATVGWTLIAEVDTRPAGSGGQHAALVAGPDGASLGLHRHLLFDLRRTEATDPFGNTFLSEIDVIDRAAPAPTRVQAPEPVIKTFKSKDGKFSYTIDATKAPDLVPWIEEELRPVVEEWYPRMIAMMPSPGFTASTEVTMTFKDDMGGTPAYAAGNRLSLSIPFFRNQLAGEARGCVIHELVHVIQNYGRARRTNRNPSPTPGWVTEGIADYVRWFLFEPEKHGAEITRRNLRSARYDGSYRISANFLDWVVRKHDKDLLQKLNAAAREGRYQEDLWRQWTGMPLEELGTLWLTEHHARLDVPMPR